MLIERLPVDKLKPAPYNPRVALSPGDPAFEKLERSLTEFELVQPLVWNRRTGHVVGGHQRLEVLKHHGQTEVDCVVVDLPLAREKALNITLNNSSVGSDWDPERLLSVLDDLHQLPDFDATLTGFDEQQLQDLLLSPAPHTPSDPCAESLPHAEDAVHVTLDIPTDRWDEVNQWLDELLASEPTISLHVRLPNGR